ncbi:dihydrolipoamide acetyltransferase family protein [Arthrobacter sp. KNU-44]|uniref:dihydrolipoamide acetyltransferase family protein n=1 Tax=Arthrobacter sp. KNU-44 TaxID=3450744 RepID=UPI003F43F6ED
MPEVLAGASEAAIATWTIAEGTTFAAGDIIAEIETEKAIVELPAENGGTLGRILVQAGNPTNVGDPIAVLTGEGETAADIEAALGGAMAGAGAAADGEVAAVGQDQAHTPAGGGAEAASANLGDETARLFASPVSRRRAREAGIALMSIRGTGPGGRIVRADVEAAITERDAANISAASTAALPSPTSSGKASSPMAASLASEKRNGAAQDTSADAESGFTAIPHSGMRRAIARRLTESKTTVPHFYLSAECRVDDLFALRKQLNEFSAVKISVNDLVVKAVAAAYAAVPEANVTWTDTHLRQWTAVDISVAVATETGLLTPVVREVDKLNLSSVSARIAELAGRAREGRIRQEELEGGSVSVTNLGMYGTLEFAAILNPPQSAILAVGAAKQAAVVVDGDLQVATVMRFTLSVDHRAVDGALAARWLAAFTTRIENPLSILA